MGAKTGKPLHQQEVNSQSCRENETRPRGLCGADDSMDNKGTPNDGTILGMTRFKELLQREASDNDLEPE